MLPPALLTSLACGPLLFPYPPANDRPLEPELAARVAVAAAGEFIPVDVVLAEQADVEFLEALASIPDRRERRTRVIALLRETAERTQGPLIEHLRTERAAGRVRGEIERLWIHNVVSAEVSPELAVTLAARTDVELVHYGPPRGAEVLGSLALQPSGGTPTCGLDLIGAPRVRSEFGITGQGVVVGVIDTGLCTAHPDIAGRLWRNPLEIAGNGLDDDQNGFIDDLHGWNFRGDNADIDDDQTGHGSAVTGIVAGDGSGGTRCGVAPGARIMVIKVYHVTTPEQSVWDGIQYGVANGADVLNGSLGWYQNSAPQRAIWRSVCRNAMLAGVVPCFIAGNEGCSTAHANVRTPGDVPDVITVGAVDCSDVVGPFSSCGPVTWQTVAPFNDHPFPPGLTKPDVSAPGVAATTHSACNGYYASNGTSLAAPHVAGLVALMLEANPQLDTAGVKSILEATAVDLGTPGKDDHYGSGRVDAYEAVRAALAQGNYCSAKRSSCGTQPSITSVGVPSASATSGFTVIATGMRALQPGFLVYGASGGTTLPAFGGRLCVESAVRTVPVLDTMGSDVGCDGVLSIDMNAYRAGLLGGGPAHGALATPGATIRCQFFGRDPGNSSNSVHTAALEFTIEP